MSDTSQPNQLNDRRRSNSCSPSQANAALPAEIGELLQTLGRHWDCRTLLTQVLHASREVDRSRTIEIDDELSDEIFKILVRSQKSMLFNPREGDNPTAESEDGEVWMKSTRCRLIRASRLSFRS